MRHFLCSVLAGVAASIVTHPFDVIKTQVQVSKSHIDSGNIQIKLIFKTTQGCILYIFFYSPGLVIELTDFRKLDDV